VAGIVRASGNKFASIWMTYAEGQHLFGASPDFQIGFLQLAPSADPQGVRSELQAEVGFSGRYVIYLETALSDRYNQANHDLLTLSAVQALISLLAITFGTYNAVSLSIAERSHEILLLRVVGFTRDKLRAFLLAHFLVLASIAYLLGWVATFLFVNFQQAHSTISILAAPLELHLSAVLTLLGFLLTVVFAFLGVWLTVGHHATLDLSVRRE
jgi:ABC-type antimicrobial peptide transport system permease subunit